MTLSSAKQINEVYVSKKTFDTESQMVDFAKRHELIFKGKINSDSEYHTIYCYERRYDHVYHMRCRVN